MPHSLVLTLMPRVALEPQFLTGRHLHGLFLSQVRAVNRELGDRLHQARQYKAFTLSPLQTGSPAQPLRWQHRHKIAAGRPCWWRITLLDDDLFSALTPLWLQIQPQQTWQLGSAPLEIIAMFATAQSGQPWAGTCPYAQLLTQASPMETTFSFQLATPTTFRQGQQDNALPTPSLVFQSLINRWQAHSAIALPPLPLEQIFPNYFKLETAVVDDARSKFIGAVGEVSYRLFGDATPAEIQALNALADFALYSGMGRKTPMGMGMMRRLLA